MSKSNKLELFRCGCCGERLTEPPVLYVKGYLHEWTPEEKARWCRLMEMGNNGEEGTPQCEEEQAALMESVLGPGWEKRNARCHNRKQMPP